MRRPIKQGSEVYANFYLFNCWF